MRRSSMRCLKKKKKEKAKIWLTLAAHNITIKYSKTTFKVVMKMKMGSNTN